LDAGYVLSSAGDEAVRKTDDIDDPTWHDIFDRDDEIKRLQKLRAQQDELISVLQREIEVLRCGGEVKVV
jgi:hypothetical protein